MHSVSTKTCEFLEVIVNCQDRLVFYIVTAHDQSKCLWSTRAENGWLQIVPGRKKQYFPNWASVIFVLSEAKALPIQNVPLAQDHFVNFWGSSMPLAPSSVLSMPLALRLCTPFELENANLTFFFNQIWFFWLKEKSKFDLFLSLMLMPDFEFN